MLIKNCFPIYLCLLSLITVYLSTIPGHNGDMPFYIACAIEKEQASMDSVHDKTIAALKSELPEMVSLEHIQRFSAMDPEILERYRIKPLYILMILAFHQIGISYTFSTVLPSILAYFLLGISIWQMSARWMSPLRATVISLLCMVIAPTLELARLSSPDALSCYVLLNALFIIINQGKKIVWFTLFLVALTIRLDNYVTELIVLFALWKWPTTEFKNKLSTKSLVLFIIILTIVSFGINAQATHEFFWFMNPHFSIPKGQYYRDVKMYFLVFFGSFFMYELLFFVITAFSRGWSWKTELNYIFYILCAVVTVRFLLYPYYEERYLIPYMLFFLLCLSFSGNKNQGILRAIQR